VSSIYFRKPLTSSFRLKHGTQSSNDFNQKDRGGTTLQESKGRIQRGESKRQVAESLGMPESTLRLRLQRGYQAISLGHFKVTFSADMEQELVEHVKTTDNMFYGLTIKGLRALAFHCFFFRVSKYSFQFAQKSNTSHRFDAAKQMAGKDWVYGFLKRHQGLSRRQPTATGTCRAIGFNKVQMKWYFNNLEHLLTKFKFRPHSICNMDETGVSTVQTKTPKVITSKWKRSVNKIVSGERGQTITIVCCRSASGNFVPPTFIFSRKRIKAELLDGAPPSSVGMVSESGFINSELFQDWL
jgi:hypothetical protein